MGLFINRNFISHSGLPLDFKIECDSLTDNDLETIAMLISKKYNFNYVQGVPRGGLRLAEILKKYCNDEADQILIVDDVLTTGKSMNETKSDYTIFTKSKIQGVVIFSRGECPDWVDPIFQFGKWGE